MVHIIVRLYGGFIKNVTIKFRSTFTIFDAKPRKRMRRVRTGENIYVIEASIAENGNLSIQRRAQEVGLCPSTLWKILGKAVKEFKLHDYHMRREFNNW